jgi:hypothetical protein
MRVRTPAERSRIASGDASEEASRDRAVLDAERRIPPPVAQRQHLLHKGAVRGIDRRPVEWLVGQRFGVEGPQRVGRADDLEERFEQVELATRELVAVVDRMKVSLM